MLRLRQLLQRYGGSSGAAIRCLLLSRVLHSLSQAALNGALGVVEPPFASSAARGRVPVRIVSVRAVTDSHPAAVAVKPENLRLCTADELARLHVEPLVKYVQNELHAASVVLQAAGDDVPKIDAALTRLRACVEHAEAALAYVEGPDNALTEDVTGTARVRLAATYAFFSATACANVASACQGRCDLAGQLAAYARAFNKALQHPMVHAVAKSFRHTGLVVNTLLGSPAPGGSAARGRAAAARRNTHCFIRG